ncbi:hypothetical protein [Vulcaniibacterium tengchongense]|uniref:Uncharacterized protein n=1 Tax=Vulcaniibacterium tengchongense TaxID=1273429 RepID=A0A3N4VNM4_9GAMM|nr:hypothetical protein [Vulcaniibacterium tengchongense]RPE74684.1 hypothetical protein EDC50_3095 [Vulcaniibacterium tengchongense]
MQNLVSIDLTPADMEALDGALATIQSVLGRGVALTAQQRRDLTKMGDKSEAFCRQTLTLLSNNPQVVPPSLGLSEAMADLAALDALRPRLEKLRQLAERAADTELALGSDVMGVALEGYALLKVAGKGEALKSARRELSARFARQARAKDPALAD